MFRKSLITAAALAALLIPAAPAFAEPAPIDSGSGPRSVGVQIDDGSGVPGPSFDTPVSIPSVGDKPEKPGEDATEEELKDYEKAVAAYERQVNARTQAEAQERARQIAQAYRECINAPGDGDRLC